MENEELLNKKMDEVLPSQKPKDERDFFERNKKLLIILIVTLIVLWAAANIYFRVSLRGIADLLNI